MGSIELSERRGPMKKRTFVTRVVSFACGTIILAGTLGYAQPAAPPREDVHEPVDPDLPEAKSVSSSIAAGALTGTALDLSTQAVTQVAATVHRHVGFFVRPDIGVGAVTTSESTGTSAGDMTVSGSAGLLGVVVGEAIKENIMLGAHIYGLFALKPKAALSSGFSQTTSYNSLNLVGIGPQISYYLMPSNIYLSFTLALTRVSLKASGSDSNSNAGVGARVAVGKEWWVSDHWGVGVAGHVSSSWNQVSAAIGNPPSLSTWAFAVAFSATYN